MLNTLSLIKQDQLTARKNKDKLAASLLTTLLGEIQTKTLSNPNKLSEEDLVISTVKYFLKNINETYTLTKNPDLLIEQTCLTKYLPINITTEELTTLIKTYIELQKSNNAPVNIGSVMGYLNNQKTPFDRAEASKIIKSCL